MSAKNTKNIIWDELKSAGMTTAELKQFTGKAYSELSANDLQQVKQNLITALEIIEAENTQAKVKAKVTEVKKLDDSDLEAMFLDDDDEDGINEISEVTKPASTVAVETVYPSCPLGNVEAINTHLIARDIESETILKQDIGSEGKSKKGFTIPSEPITAKSQVWENGVPIPQDEWKSKRILEWLETVLPEFGIRNFNPSKPFYLMVSFSPAKEWKKAGDKWQERELKTPTTAANMNRKRTAFYKSVHSAAPSWIRDTLKNQEKIESEFVHSTFWMKERIPQDQWLNSDDPEYSKEYRANSEVDFLQFLQGSGQPTTYIKPLKERPKQTLTPRQTVRRSDVKLDGLVQPTGLYREVWHPTLDVSQNLLTRFRFNMAYSAKNTQDASASNSGKVWMDYKTGTSGVMSDGWMPLYELGSIEVIPLLERYAYLPEATRYNAVAHLASKHMRLDDCTLAEYLNNHPKIKEYYPGVRFTVYQGTISRVGTGMKAVAIKQLVKVQNKVVIRPSESCYRKGQRFPAMLSTLRDAEKWLQANYQSLIASENPQAKVTQSGKAQENLTSRVKFMVKQLLRNSWQVKTQVLTDEGKWEESRKPLDEATAIAIASRLASQVTPTVAKQTVSRMNLKAVKEVADIFSAKQVGLWSNKTDAPSKEWYDLIALLVRTVTEIDIVR